jgi:membrane protein
MPDVGEGSGGFIGQSSIRKQPASRTLLWLALWIIGAWMISRSPRTRQKAFSGLREKPERSDLMQNSSTRLKRSETGPGIPSLAFELIGAVAVRLAQRYVRSWSAEIIAEIKSSRDVSTPPAFSAGRGPNAPVASPYAVETPHERIKAEKPYSRGVFTLLKNATNEWLQDKCPQLGAALAYFTVFSLAPLLVVLLAVFGLIFGSSDMARLRIIEQLQYFMDPGGIKAVQDIAAQAGKPKAGVIAMVVDVIVGLFGASGVFGQLQDALNTIWGVKPKPGGGLWGFLRARFLSFAMVGGVCFLLLVSLTIETVLRSLDNYLQAMLPGGQVLAMALFLIFDLLVIVLLFAFIFRYLPDARTVWKDVWIGAALTAVLFLVGKFILALYLGSGAAGSAYGAASSLITLLLWIYYSAQILLFGAEFTQVYANTYGSRVEPKRHAVKIERMEREVASG